MNLDNKIYNNILILFVVSLLISVYSYCFTSNKYTDDEVCTNLYINEKNKKYKVLKNVLTKKECQNIINEGIEYAKNNKWEQSRHRNYPTTDNEITKEWDIWELINNKIKKRIFPKMEKLFKLQKNKLNVTELFLVKYDEKGQRELKYHEDGSEFSFIITLNDDFTGGGTTFKHNKKLIKPKIGDCLIFSGQNIHKGNYIKSGTRYILTGFINYIDEYYCLRYLNSLDKTISKTISKI